MQPQPAFLVLDLSISAIERLAPLVARLRPVDRDLADQIRRAASSIALNIGEANRSLGGNRRARLCTAAGSNVEVRAALRVAVAWGHLHAADIEPVESLLDRIAAMLYRLGARH